MGVIMVIWFIFIIRCYASTVYAVACVCPSLHLVLCQNG